MSLLYCILAPCPSRGIPVRDRQQYTPGGFDSNGESGAGLAPRSEGREPPNPLFPDELLDSHPRVDIHDVDRAVGAGGNVVCPVELAVLAPVRSPSL